MFKLLGVLVGLYTIHAALRGEVYIKSRAWGRTVLRVEEPNYFWVVIAIYGALAIALLTVF